MTEVCFKCICVHEFYSGHSVILTSDNNVGTKKLVMNLSGASSANFYIFSNLQILSANF